MCHVLVIEDEFLIADHIASLAEDAGATSIVCVETEQAAVLAARHRKPDIILSDVELLVGEGPAAVATIMAELGQLPVIFITGTPEACTPCDPPALILIKPIDATVFNMQFQRLAKLG